MKDISIFLSSTYEDLKEARSQILKFLEILRSDIISMEFFGSSDHQPKDYALEELRKCNVFIGIYAERYGSIDNESGLSITELEYIEALKLRDQGQIQGVFIYMVNPETLWPINKVDREPEKIEKLSRLKSTLKSNHTITFFDSVEDLPLLVLKDVIQKIGFNSSPNLEQRKSQVIEYITSLIKPIGMEFYHSNQAKLFFGREGEILDLSNQIIKFHFALLIGLSGIGKTSLINAGIVPYFTKMGWAIATLRPLRSPLKNLKSQLWAQLMVGTPPDIFDLFDTVNAIMAAYNDRTVLIIIDQFEDVANSKDFLSQTTLVDNLVSLFNSNIDNLRILISYRGDIEPKIGSLWQKISGSSDGLPRYYLGGLGTQQASSVMSSTLDLLEVDIENNVVDFIIDDLATHSTIDGYEGIYPPFLQMVMHSIFSKKGNPYSQKKLP